MMDNKEFNFASIRTNWNGDEIKSLARKVVEGSVWDLAMEVNSRAKEYCPKRYGYLAASINVQMKNKGTELESPEKYRRMNPPRGYNVEHFEPITPPENDIEADIGTAVRYNFYMEYGTYKDAAQPFLRPAFDETFGKFSEIVEVNGKNVFADYMGK